MLYRSTESATNSNSMPKPREARLGLGDAVFAILLYYIPIWKDQHLHAKPIDSDEHLQDCTLRSQGHEWHNVKRPELT
jgi:hypothetical protein